MGADLVVLVKKLLYGEWSEGLSRVVSIQFTTIKGMIDDHETKSEPNDQMNGLASIQGSKIQCWKWWNRQNELGILAEKCED